MRTPIKSGKEICHNCPSVLHQLRSSRIVLSTFSASLTTVPPYQISCSEWCRSVAHLLWYTFMGSSLVLLYNHTSTFPFLFNKIHVPCLLTFFWRAIAHPKHQPPDPTCSIPRSLAEKQMRRRPWTFPSLELIRKVLFGAPKLATARSFEYLGVSCLGPCNQDGYRVVKQGWGSGSSYI